jgi:hypothetical protein
MFTLENKDGKAIRAGLNVYFEAGSHKSTLRIMGEPLPPIIQQSEDGSTIEVDGGREVLLMIGTGNEPDSDEQAFEQSIAEALQTLVTAKGI